MSGPPPVSASGAKGGAFVRHNLQSPVRGALDGPLSGFAAVVKDAFDIAGERTGAGSPEWLPPRNPATAPAATCRAVRGARPASR